MKGLKSCFLLCFSLLLCIQINAQTNSRTSYNFEYDEDLYSVTKVTFHRPTGLGSGDRWIVIKSDFDPNVSLSGAFSSVAWEDGEKVTPIAYVSHARARVSAEFEIICNQGNGSVEYYARGINADGYNLPIRKLQYSNGKYFYPQNNTPQRFPNNVVGYWEDFEIEWQISTSSDPDGQWIDAGTSRNYMYVTHGYPVTGIQPMFHLEPISLQHTFLHIGCKKAVGLSDKNQIVDAIYNNEFTNQDVRRFDGAGPIQYWGPNVVPGCHYPTQMLVLLNGTCGGWSAFFDVILHIQGIIDAEIVIVDWNDGNLPSNSISPLEDDIMTTFGAEHVNTFPLDVNRNPTSLSGNPPMSHFYVEKWNFQSMNHNFFVHHFYAQNNPNIAFSSSIILANGNVIEDREKEGVEGQGNLNPRSEFENHGIVRYNGNYYDPSYGTDRQSSSSDWQNSSIAGVGGLVFYIRENSSGDIERYLINWLDQPTDLDFFPPNN